MRAASSVLLWAIVALFVLCGIVGWVVISRGFSARGEPAKVETYLARKLRRMAIPREIREAKNPVAPSSQVMDEAMAHFADHCATCHANDGSGGTLLGLGLYPPPPDLRLPPTQQLTDGELFYIIHEGVRFTGMPAFGSEDASKDVDSWKLVHFIRVLPRLTADELERMKTMNPKSPMQSQMEEEMKRFLEGGDTAAPSDPHRNHK
jgi:mono/diheme cytochrome c family protein